MKLLNTGDKKKRILYVPSKEAWDEWLDVSINTVLDGIEENVVLVNKGRQRGTISMLLDCLRAKTTLVTCEGWECGDCDECEDYESSETELCGVVWCPKLGETVDLYEDEEVLKLTTKEIVGLRTLTSPHKDLYRST